MEIQKPLLSIQEFDRVSMAEKLKELDVMVATFGPQHPIVIQIDSYGGEVAALSMLYSKLRTIENPIITYTPSVAMSCGAVLLTLGAKKTDEGPTRIASEGACIMLHDFSSVAGGFVDDIGTKYMNMKAESEYWFGLVAKSIGLKNRDELLEKIRKISKGGGDTYLTAQEALELGIIDMIGDVCLTPYQGYDIAIKPTDKEIDKILEKQEKKKKSYKK